MGNALRDQLLKVGLVNEKQAKKAAKEKHKESLQQQGKARKDSEDKLRAQQAQAEKSERDRLLNQLRQEQMEKKALAAQIRQLVEQHGLAKEDGETPYNFADGGKVKRLYLSDKLRQGIASGRIAIIRLENDYELVPSDTVEKIRARDPGSVVVLNSPQTGAGEASADDPYAKYQIPDDLMW